MGLQAAYEGPFQVMVNLKKNVERLCYYIITI